MNTDELNRWGKSIIEKVKSDRLNFSKDPMEFSIFYSPLKTEPSLMIIGDNPGGQVGEPGLYEIPEIHEYIDAKQTYPIAVAMRKKILKGDKLSNVLANSVKLNRIFFRTPDLKTFANLNKGREIQEYCKDVLDEIIETIKPRKILAESFGTFKALSASWTSILDKPTNNKSILLLGQYKGIEVFGINHPSQAWRQGIDNDDWERVNRELEKRLV